MKSIGVGLASKCVLCCNHEGTDLHLVFTCPVSSSVWHWLFQGFGLAQSENIPISASTVWFAFALGRNDASTKWAVMVLFNAILCIWQSRNNSMFRNSDVSLLQIKRRLVEQVAGVVSSSIQRLPQDWLLHFLGVFTNCN